MFIWYFGSEEILLVLATKSSSEQSHQRKYEWYRLTTKTQRKCALIRQVGTNVVYGIHTKAISEVLMLWRKSRICQFWVYPVLKKEGGLLLPTFQVYLLTFQKNISTFMTNRRKSKPVVGGTGRNSSHIGKAIPSGASSNRRCRCVVPVLGRPTTIIGSLSFCFDSSGFIRWASWIWRYWERPETMKLCILRPFLTIARKRKRRLIWRVLRSRFCMLPSLPAILSAQRKTICVHNR